MILHYQFKLKPTKAQHKRLRAALDHSRHLYNAALEERIGCYRKTGRGRSFMDQCRSLTELRRDPAYSIFPAIMQRGALQRLDRAFKAFFQRGGFPRFKGRDRYRTLEWGQRDGWKVSGRHFLAKGIGSVRIAAGRELPSAARGCKITREGRHWYLILVTEVECAPANDNPAIGIDLGISTFAALSNGQTIPNIRPARSAHRAIRIKQRALARCKKGSRRRHKARASLAKAHLKIARIRDTRLHQISADITRRYGKVAIESLNMKGLTRGFLARDVHDAGWGKFIGMLRYKAERAGGRVIEVNPRGTSQTCTDCGQIKAKTLSERTHSCDCGCVLDRDVAAAKVILLRAVHSPGEANVGGYVERSRGKVAANG